MSSFSSGRLAVYKNTATNNKQKKKTTFSSLKNSVQIEPVWFRLDNLTLCAALTTARYCTRLKKIQRRRSFFPTNGTIFYIVFPKYRDKLSINKKSSDKLEIPCETKFLQVLFFAIFPAIRKIISSQKINENRFSRKNLLQSIKYTLTKIYYTKIQHYETVSVQLQHVIQCTHTVVLLHVLNKNENIINAG